jgi:hypothetical protein
MNGPKKEMRTTSGSRAVTIRGTTYERLMSYRASEEMPPSIVALVSAAVERLLDEKERAKLHVVDRTND